MARGRVLWPATENNHPCPRWTGRIWERRPCLPRQDDFAPGQHQKYNLLPGQAMTGAKFVPRRPSHPNREVSTDGVLFRQAGILSAAYQNGVIFRQPNGVYGVLGGRMKFPVWQTKTTWQGFVWVQGTRPIPSVFPDRARRPFRFRSLFGKRRRIYCPICRRSGVNRDCMFWRMLSPCMQSSMIGMKSCRIWKG